MLDCQMLKFRQICMLNLQTGTSFSTLLPLIQSRQAFYSLVMHWGLVGFVPKNVTSLNILKKWSHGFWLGNKDVIEAEMEKVKFTSKNRNTKRDKSLKAVPFVMSYHPKFKSIKFILKYLDLSYMGKEVKRVFTPKPMISFRSARRLSSYLVWAKL